MITQQQKTQLVEAYRDHPIVFAGTVLKCAACMAVLLGLAILGTAGQPPDRPVVQAHGSADRPAQHELQQRHASPTQSTSAQASSPGPLHLIGTSSVVSAQGVRVLGDRSQ